MHSLEKEKSGECCQVEEKDNAQQATYEHSINLKPTTEEKHE
jgi:hypothetical protein|tara:strand:+ start:322 stop:447 length:126 start_codon:yes stop_codon:yes gene_type:complete